MSETEKRVPELRFKGFIDDWEQRKLGEVSEITKLAGFEFTKYVKYSDTGYIPAIRGLNVKNAKFVFNDVKYIDESDFSKLSRSKLFAGDIVFTYVGTIGEAAIIPESVTWYLAPNVARIRTTELNPTYLLQLLINPDFRRKEIETWIATSSQPALSMENIRKFEINFPFYEEQTKIGILFKQLDTIIALHQEKEEKLRALKKCLLNDFFPNNEDNIPFIRFANFNSAWEQRKLGEISESYSGGTPSVANQSYYGGSIPFIRSAEINSKKTELCLTEDGLKNSSAKLVEKGDILYALYGATSGEVGNSQISGAINQAILAIKPKIEYDSYFIMQWLRRQKNSIISTYLQGGQGNLSGAIVKDLIISAPIEYEEQQKIGLYFKQLDETIALHQCKIKKLIELKNVYLGKMFL